MTITFFVKVFQIKCNPGLAPAGESEHNRWGLTLSFMN